MRERIQWIGMVSLHFGFDRIGYYIPSEFDYSSANAEWVIDGPNRYYNTVTLGGRSITSKKILKLPISASNYRVYEEYNKPFKITKMLNVE